ncbi:MAG: 23S rRNA (adenine(2503)-C(2))-methyltransferase RlmN [Bacillota bacterium]
METIYNVPLDRLKKELVSKSYKAFNGRQVFEWLYKHKVTSFQDMTNLSKALRAHLEATYTFDSLPLFHKQTASDQTKKYLFKLHDEHVIETVLMHHDYGDSLCVTSQVGCNIGCSFCASGLQKRIRNLTAGEMVMQLNEVETLEGLRISHVVIMGTGEPFDNYDNVMDFVDIINSPYGLEIGARHITISTSGIIPKIDAFANETKQVNLALSLHAPNDEIRTKLMKINETYPMKPLLKSIENYIEKTNRRVTIEYILLNHVNDDISHANELSDKLRGLNVYVNLIRYNPVSEFHYQPSDPTRADAFHAQLLKRGINATLRKEMGSDIDAACGQLRTKMKESA